MIIAMPVEEKSLNSNVCPSFGRAPYFLLYSTASGEANYLDNSAAASQGGAGIRAAQVIADHGARALITPRCGENVQKALSGAEVLIYKALPGTVRQNIDAFKEDKLVLLSDFHPSFHGNEG